MPEQATSLPRGMWSGLISFGLVSIPVELYPAQRSSTPRLRMLDEDGTPLRRRYVCPAHGEPLTTEEIVRGYELDDGRFVVVTDQELEQLAPEKSREIDLRRFVDLDEIDPVHFDRPYFLAPSAESAKAYRLLAATMERKGRAGIASFVMRGKEYLVAILAENGILRAETLRLPREIRSAEDVGLPEPREVESGRVKQLRQAIGALAEHELDDEELSDRQAARLMALVERKQEAGRDVVEAEQAALPGKAEIVDLMEVLRRRLERSENEETGEELAGLSKPELYDRAKELDIPGRSSMSKDELIEAIRVAAAS